MEKQLQMIGTSIWLIETILPGFYCWCGPQPNTSAQALVAGSVHPSDFLLTSAFYDQFHQLHWFQLCLSRISQKWSLAIIAYQPTIDAPYWASLFVSILWKFTKSLWSKWNEFIHQQTTLTHVDTRLLTPHNTTTEYSTTFHSNPDFFLPWFHSLFTQQTLSQCPALSHDYLQNWVSSIRGNCDPSDIIAHNTATPTLFPIFQSTS
jgi:hypothetical protein